jgi:PAS domain S-box-containing protein
MRNDPLDAVWRESELALEFARTAKFRDVADLLLSQQRFIASLQGRDAAVSDVRNKQFDEAAFEAQLIATRMPTVICLHWIRKLKARYLRGDYAEALAAADNAKALLSVSSVSLQLLDYFYYTALTVAALYDEASADAQSGWRDRLAAHLEQLREWAENYPPTFSDKHFLVAAEIARIEGRDADAMRLYEAAIRGASENGFIQNEGLAYEVAARFYAARGLQTITHAYLRNARLCYLRWGAHGKVRQLEQLHPKLLEEDFRRSPAALVGAHAGQFDIGAVLRASQAVSSEIAIDRLIETLMKIALEHAGAERGLLILLRGETLQIEAEARTGGKAIEVALRQAPVTPAAVPEAVLHTVVRTQRSVLLDDASVPNPFAADNYVRRTNARSVLCLPLLKQAELVGVLYLENNLASHVFTQARISVLELLASQAAISLENARLYAELQVSEDRWRNLFEKIPVGLALIDSHSHYIAANRVLQGMTGYSEAELLNLSPVDITHEDDRPATAAIVAERAAGSYDIQRVEKRYRRKDGSVIWVDVSAFVATFLSGAPLLAGVIVDITDRKRAEEELRRSEASLAQAQEISRTGSWRWTAGSDELSLSAEFLRIFGFDPSATRVSYTTFRERIHPEDRPLFEQAIAGAVRDRTAIQRDYRITLPDGSIKHLQSIGRPGLNESGVLEYFGTVMDISERRRAEEALRDAQAELARMMRLTTLGELAASLAHEINQPLSAITLNAASGVRWLNQQPPNLDEARQMLSHIGRDGVRAGDVIRGLRALSQKSGVQLARLDIRDAIEEVLALTRGEVQRHRIVLRTDLAAGAQPVLGDRVQLQQVLLNLIMNAIQAMAPVTDRGRELLVSVVRTEPGRVLVAVEDTGPGLDPAVAQRIFDPFFTTKSDGLGIGLSICRSIIKAHGGELYATPRLPRGAVFRFHLRIDSQEAP